MTLSYPQYYSLLKQAEQEVVRQILLRLASMQSTIGIKWGGSTSNLTERSKWADVDLWILVNDNTEYSVRDAVLAAAVQVPHLAFLLDAGFFAFFGHLVQLFFFPGCTFGVDVGICTSKMLDEITPGAGSVLVWGSWPHDRNSLNRRTGSTPERRLSIILLNLIKVRKAVHRGYLWNAIEYTARARRQLMGLLIGDGPTTEIRYSRPDHSVEAVMSDGDLMALSTTCPTYLRKEVACCASRVGELAIAWGEQYGIGWAPLAELRLVTSSLRVSMKY